MALEIGGGITFEGGISITPETGPTTTWAFDPAYTGSTLSLANNNNSILSNSPGFPTSIGTKEVSTAGMIMFSVTLNFDFDGAHPIQYYVGISNHSTDVNNPIGGDTNSFAYATDGTVYYNNSVQVSGLSTWGSNSDVIDVAINPASNSIWFRVNGGYWNNDPAVDPGTNPNTGIEIPNGPYYPAVSVGAEGGPSEFTIESSPRYAVPSGFTFIAGTQLTSLRLNLDAGDLASGGIFGSDGSSWIDISGYDNNATFTNANIQNQGSSNAYFSFDGSGSSYATIDWSTSMSPTSQITWETWAYSDTTPSGDSSYHWILRNGWEGAPWYHGLNTTGQWELVINDTGYDTTAGPQLTSGWHQIVGTYDGTNIRMYLDGTYTGTLVGTATGAITGYNMSVPTIIGGGSSSGSGTPPPNQQFWNGGIAVLKMYDTQLSPSVIAANFEALRSRYGL